MIENKQIISKTATTTPSLIIDNNPCCSDECKNSRRDVLRQSLFGMIGFVSATTTTILTSQQQQPAHAMTTTTTASSSASPGGAIGIGNLSDLPPEAVRSYLQYRIPLQTATDFYIFELLDNLQDVSDWGQIGELFTGKTNRIEREFTNIFRIIGLSMPPDEADLMRDAQYKFEKAMGTLSKITNGIRRDLPIEIEKDAVPNAILAWNDGRIALNDFLTVLNSATGLNEMTIIPSSNKSEYTRSERKYVELKKKIKLCQNRGGPTLSNAWGQLMVSGYLQDSCGIPDLDKYFYQ